MRTLIAILLAGTVGLLVGWAVGSRTRPAPAPVEASPQLESDLRAAREEIARLRNRPEAPPPPATSKAPEPEAVPTPAAAKPAIPDDWKARVGGLRSAAEVLDAALPEGDAGLQAAAREFLRQRARSVLRDPEAQEGLLRDLPAWPTARLVQLWDVFWLRESDHARGFSAFGESFGPRMGARLLDMVASESDPTRRSLACNLLKPDTRHLSDGRLEEFRRLLKPEDAEKLPRRD